MKKLTLSLLLCLLVFCLNAQQSKYYKKGFGNYWVQSAKNIVQENDTTLAMNITSTNFGEGWVGNFKKTNTSSDSLSFVTYLPPPPYVSLKIFNMVITDFGYAMTGDIETLSEEDFSYAHLLLTDSSGNLIKNG